MKMRGVFTTIPLQTFYIMDLFSQDPDLSIYKEAFGKWWDVLDRNILIKAYDDTIAFASKGEITPKIDNVFKAYRCSDPEAIKCLILSQCPYPDNNADGLAFSAEVPTESLRQIFFAITKERDLFDKNIPFPYETNLNFWCDQGVLLLNVKLAIYLGDTISGKGLHNDLISETCKYLAGKCEFLSIGKEATRLLKASLDCEYHSCSHPVESSRSGLAWHCDKFDAINNELLAQGLDPIKWIQWKHSQKRLY